MTATPPEPGSAPRPPDATPPAESAASEHAPGSAAAPPAAAPPDVAPPTAGVPHPAASPPPAALSPSAGVPYPVAPHPVAPYPAAGYPEPSRGTLVLVLGIVGLLVTSVAGPVAWWLGVSERRDIAAGRRPPSGQGAATAGMVLGIIASALLGVGLIVLVFAVVALAAALAVLPFTVTNDETGGFDFDEFESIGEQEETRSCAVEPCGIDHDVYELDIVDGGLGGWRHVRG